MEITDKIGSLLVLIGAVWMLLGTLGLLRFPDVYTRLHSSGLVSPLGVTLVLLGLVVHFAPLQVSASLLAGIIIVFVLLTYPLATTAMIWAAHRTGVRAYQEPVTDELEIHDQQEVGAEAGILLEESDTSDH